MRGWANGLRANRPDVIDEVFDGEAVIVNLRTGRYYALDAAGTEIWQQTHAGRGVDQIAADLAVRESAPPAALESVVCDFVERLLEEELLSGAWERPNSQQDAQEPTCSFAPTIQVFTDMTDLLLLDPIHEVDLDGSGWPSIAPAASA